MSDDDDLDPAAVAYDRELVPWLFEHWAEPMVDLVAPEPSSHVVDIACGSGLIVRHLLGRVGAAGSVDGVDIDAALLAVATESVRDDRVNWHESDAARLPFENSSMDRVSCHQGLQFFPERSAALAEIRRLLVPGGRLAVATWGRLEDNPWPAAMSRAVGQLLGDDAGAAMAVVCDLGDPGELVELLRRGGSEGVVVAEQERTVTHRDVRVAVAGQRSALPSGSAIDELAGERRSELVELMCEMLAGHTDEAGRLDVRSTCNLASGLKA